MDEDNELKQLLESVMDQENELDQQLAVMDQENELNQVNELKTVSKVLSCKLIVLLHFI